MMHLQLENISKSFGNEKVLHQLQLQLAANKTLSILGTSGCGKTTLLKIIAGIEKADEGNIFLDEKNITPLPPNQRNIVYIYQEPLLFPHLNIFENIAFGLRIRKWKDALVRQKVEALLEELGLSAQALKLPQTLSGGQRQRAAFGRAIIINPPVLLLDEPFASLDFETRTSMQQLFKSVAHRYHITSIFVTHDLKEAILMADEIALMRNGTLQHFASVAAFKQDPASGIEQEIAFWNNIAHQ